MTKDNYIIVITLISVLLLLLSQSVYDPSVYAKMQKVDDDNLSDVTGEALILEINATVSAFASDISINNNEGDSLKLGPTAIGGSSGIGSTRIYSSQLADIGSVTGQTWILLGNLELPYSAGGNTLGVNISNLSYIGHYWNGTTRVRDSRLWNIGNLTIARLEYGHNVTGITPWLNLGSPPYMMYSANDDNGLEINSQMGGYIETAMLKWNNSASTVNDLTATGIYLYFGYGNDIANPNPAAWTSSLSGKMLLGGVMPGFDNNGNRNAAKNRTIMAAINIGTSGTRSTIFMDLPMYGSIRVRNLTLGTLNLGPVAIDELVMYRNMVEWNLGRFNE